MALNLGYISGAYTCAACFRNIPKLHQGEILTDPNVDKPIHFPNLLAYF